MTMSQLEAVIAKVVAKQFAQVTAAKQPVKASKASKKPAKVDFEAALIAAAIKAGYANPEPRFNLLTYDRWLEKGLRVRKGEKSIRVNGKKSGLFHESQCSPEPKAAA